MVLSNGNMRISWIGGKRIIIRVCVADGVSQFLLDDSEKK